jgi:hypothetical protein
MNNKLDTQEDLLREALVAVELIKLCEHNIRTGVDAGMWKEQMLIHEEKYANAISKLILPTLRRLIATDGMAA